MTNTIPEMKHCHVMQKNDIEAYAECFAHAFEGYSLFEYFSGRKYDVRKMMLFWKVLLTASREQSFCIGDAYYPNTVALFYPPDYKDAGFLQYIKAGGWKIMFRFGLRSTAQMLRFEALAEKIKAKYAPEKCWYLYGYVTRPEFRNQGCGSRILKPILDYFDATGQACYLETLKEENVSLYGHYGFSLAESSRVPGTDMTLYAMVRNGR